MRMQDRAGTVITFVMCQGALSRFVEVPKQGRTPLRIVRKKMDVDLICAGRDGIAQLCTPVEQIGQRPCLVSRQDATFPGIIPQDG